MRSFEEVDQEVSGSYKSLRPVVEEIVGRATKEVDRTLKIIEDKMEDMTDMEINKLMLRLSVDCYHLGYYMEHSNIKADCAKAVMKEAQSREFVNAVGSNDVKKNRATLETVEEVAVSTLYDGVARILETKLGEAHRVVDTLKSIQISRMHQNKSEVRRSEEME